MMSTDAVPFCSRSRLAALGYLVGLVTAVTVVAAPSARAGRYGVSAGGAGLRVHGRAGGVHLRTGHHGGYRGYQARSYGGSHGAPHRYGYTLHGGRLKTYPQSYGYRGYYHATGYRHGYRTHRGYSRHGYRGHGYGGYGSYGFYRSPRYYGPGYYRGSYGYDCGYAHGYGCGYRVYGFTIPGGGRSHGEGAPRFRTPAARPYAVIGAGSVAAMPAYTSDSADPYMADADVARAVAVPDPWAAGWELLADGRTTDALPLFAGQARASPGAGQPKAGYALAYAMTGDLATGAWAMRRAFRTDPDSLRTIVMPGPLGERVREVIGRYESTVAKGHGASVDGAFMVTALSFLLHDDATARATAARMAVLGDRSRSAQNLSRLVSRTAGSTDGYAAGDADTSRGRRPTR